MISIFKETKGSEVEGGKRTAAEEASQNKAHDSNNTNNGNSEASTNGTATNGEKGSVAPNAKDAAPKEGNAGTGEGAEGKSSGAPTINGSSAAPATGGPKKMSYAQMANASKAAAAAVST